MNSANFSDLLQHAKVTLKTRLNLVADKAPDDVIDEEIRSGIEVTGSNLWLLVSAILIASIGLNVNSTAVIIGAMLISPLMGPIMGIGYGTGINDPSLIRRSASNLLVASLIALVTSTLYFMLTPLSGEQSELLARTTPTIWDVMVALFGGFAGVVGATRRSKTNVIPGVAIATALMPPLCTAGFGVATANWKYFLGAFYLFFINSVYIALATMLVTRAFHVPLKSFANEMSTRRIRRYMGLAVVLTLVPSLYLAYGLVQDEIFKSKATQFIHQEFESGTAHVAQLSLHPKSRLIEVSLVGEPLTKERVLELSKVLSSRVLANARLEVHQTSQDKIDVTSLKASLLTELYQGSQAQLKEHERLIESLQAKLAESRSSQERLRKLADELHVLFPEVRDPLLSEAETMPTNAASVSNSLLILNGATTRGFNTEKRERLARWLGVRAGTGSVRIFLEKTR